VERDEPLFEISTDKVDTEIPSPAAGVLAEVVVQEGQTVGINTIVGRIAESGEVTAPAKAKEAAPETPAPAEPEAEPAAEPEVETVPAESSEVAGPVSPLVRRIAREHNLDLSRIPGTGAGGRITKQDVEAYIASQKAAPAMPAPQQAAPAAEKTDRLSPAQPAKARVEPMSTMRQKIAEHMVYSLRTSAHVTTVHRVDVSRIAKLRERLKTGFKEQYGFSLTYLPFFARAAAQALRGYPLVNASVEGSNILYHNEVHIGIAVALENGLIVPVIRNADDMSIVGLQRAIADLASRARSRQLRPEEVQGATFSITNFGSYGSLFATPVINQPNVAILGVGAVTKEPVVVEDAIAIRSMCYVSLTFDHRLIDGALGDQFVLKIKEVLEGWTQDGL
jgi:2-oxoglutarate dehydrogenase E2 component (dihydrolipoamide succinyltransferase)